MQITNNLDTSPHKCVTDHNLSSPANIENWAEATIITVRGMSLGVFPSLPLLSGERPSCRDCQCQTCVTSSELNNSMT